MGFTWRRLPHLSVVGVPVFVTFRLYGSLPNGRYFSSDPANYGREFAAMDRLLDECRVGPTFLRNPEVAREVLSGLQGDTSQWDLHAWVLMPNHVHALLTPGIELSHVLNCIKGVSARRANQVMETTGTTFWQRESFDRIIRDKQQFAKVVRYIENNPVRAGLAETAEEFRWSSAFQRSA